MKNRWQEQPRNTNKTHDPEDAFIIRKRVVGETINEPARPCWGGSFGNKSRPRLGVMKIRRLNFGDDMKISPYTNPVANKQGNATECRFGKTAISPVTHELGAHY